MRFLTVLFLCAQVFVLFTWMSRTPAFNGDLRVAGASGETILQDPSAMYDNAQYLFETGYGFVFPDVGQFLLDEEELTLDLEVPTMPDFDQMLADAQTGAEYLEQSIALAPASGQAWMVLAWARAIADQDVSTILDALRRSWALKPHDRVLADRRLALMAALVSEQPDAGGLVTDADLAAIEIDKAILMRYDPRALQQMAEISPNVPFLSTEE